VALAIVALNIVELSCLTCVLLRQVLLVESLKLIRTENFDFFFNDADHITKTLQVKLTRPIAFSARQSLIINLGSFALVARNVLLNALFIRVRPRHNQVTLDLLSVLFCMLHLIAAINCDNLRLAIGAAILHDRADLA
jgi:hypothetical protein